MVKALEKYSPNTIRMKSSSPKILPLAPCFYYLSLLDDYTSEEKGRVLELLVGSQLVRTDAQLYYWREGNVEVDFVLKRGRYVWAIEVKTSGRVSYKGLEAFQKKFPKSHQVVITLGRVLI